jgi:hypothetical protein
MYVNHSNRTFSVTARKTVGARLSEVNADQINSGFVPYLISSGVTEEVANRQKRHAVAVQRTAGYRKVARAPL